MAFIYIMTDVKMFPNKIDRIQILSFGFSILFIHYFLFVYKYKYKQIEEEFKHESQAERKRKGAWVLLYTFGSIVLYALLGFLGIWLRNNGYVPLIKFLSLVYLIFYCKNTFGCFFYTLMCPNRIYVCCFSLFL